MGGPRPAIITNIQGKDITIRYTAKARGLARVKQAELTPNKDFDWCGGIALDSLQEGSAVEGRYLHGEGGKKWFRGKIAAINSNGTFAISYNDGDYEASVLRENIRTEADRDRPNPQLAQLNGKSMNQSFASSLSPAHRDSESPKQTTKPAQAEPAEATGEAEATRKQAKQSKAAETRVAVKEEPVEEYDGSYACLICGESVRGMEALKCSHWQCESNPLHRACITNPKWLHECPSCKRQTMKPWSGAGGRHAAAVATIDLTTGGGKGRSDAQDPQGAASEPMRERGQGGETGARQKRVARASSAAAMVASGDVTDTGKGGGARGRLEPETRAQKGKRRRPAADVASPGPTNPRVDRTKRAYGKSNRHEPYADSARVLRSGGADAQAYKMPFLKKGHFYSAETAVRIAVELNEREGQSVLATASWLVQHKKVPLHAANVGRRVRKWYHDVEKSLKLPETGGNRDLATKMAYSNVTAWGQGGKPMMESQSDFEAWMRTMTADGRTITREAVKEHLNEVKRKKGASQNLVSAVVLDRMNACAHVKNGF